ncbi:hypothetical protein P73_4141 [Celeribacter indicus]|uniref:Uncharacterized protein n=1 Tax=Celeribacter indicus TaxID=1208324 RepID=A0A0B5E741_9RHOB|nr:hypothetical protein P73_4141 [Celeribacter indicus]
MEVFELATEKKQIGKSERPQELDLLPRAADDARPDRLSGSSSLNGMTATAIGMGLALQLGSNRDAAAFAGEAGGESDTPNEGDATSVAAGTMAPAKPAGGVAGEEVAAQPSVLSAPVVEDVIDPALSEVAAGGAAAAGRTSEIENAGYAADRAQAVLAEIAGAEGASSFSGVGTGTSQGVLPGGNSDNDGGGGLLDTVLDPILGDEGLLDSLLDALFGEDGILSGLLGDEGAVGELLDGLIGEDGLIDLGFLEDLLGDDGLLGGIVDIIAGEDGLLSGDGILDPILGDDGLLGGLLDPILDLGPVDDLLGENGLLPDLTDQLFGEDGLIDGVVGDIPVLDPILGDDGLLGGLLGSGGLLGGLLGGGGSDAAGDPAPSDEPPIVEDASDDGFLHGLLGLGEDVTTGLADAGTDIVSGLLGDDDVFGLDVLGDADGDLFAGLAGDDSLAGLLIEQGVIGGTGDADEGEVDTLLSEILGPAESDLAAGGDALGALLGEDGAASLADGLTGLLTDGGPLDLGSVFELSDGPDLGVSLLDGLLPDQSDQ